MTCLTSTNGPAGDVAALPAHSGATKAATQASFLVVRVTHAADETMQAYLPQSKAVDDDPKFPLMYALDQALHALHIALFEMPYERMASLVRQAVEISFIVSQPARQVKSSFLDTPHAQLVPEANRVYLRLYRWQLQQMVWDAVMAEELSTL